MAFVVATGLDIGNADSYVSLADANAYFEAMQDAAWDAVDEDKRLWLLRRASTLIDQRYRWSVTDVPFISVPRALAIATFELAKHWSLSPISSSVTESPGIKRVQVGAIAVEYAGSGESGAPEQIYAFIDSLLSKLGTPRIVATATASNPWGSITIARA